MTGHINSRLIFGADMSNFSDNAVSEIEALLALAESDDHVHNRKNENFLLNRSNQSLPVELKEELAHLKEENEKMKKLIRNAQLEIKKSQSFVIPKENRELAELLLPLKQALEMEQLRVSEMQDLWTMCEQKSNTLKKRINELTQENAELIIELNERTGAPSDSQLHTKQLQQISQELDNWKDNIEGMINNITKTIGDKSCTTESASEFPYGKEVMEQINELKQKLDEATDKKKETIAQNLKENQIRQLEYRINDLQAENSRLRKKTILKMNQPEPEETGDSRVEDLEVKLRHYEQRNSNLEDEVDWLRFQKVSRPTAGASDCSEEVRVRDLKDTVRKLRQELDHLRRKVSSSDEDTFPASANYKNLRLTGLEN